MQKKLNFEIFKSTLYMKSWTKPFDKQCSPVWLIHSFIQFIQVYFHQNNALNNIKINKKTHME